MRRDGAGLVSGGAGGVLGRLRHAGGPQAGGRKEGEGPKHHWGGGGGFGVRGTRFLVGFQGAPKGKPPF